MTSLNISSEDIKNNNLKFSPINGLSPVPEVAINIKETEEKKEKPNYKKIISIISISGILILILIGCEIGISLISDNNLISQDITSVQGSEVSNSFTMMGNYIEVRVRFNSLCVIYYDSDIVTKYPGNKTFIINSNDVKEFKNCELLDNKTKIEDVKGCYYKKDNEDSDIITTTITDILPSLFGMSNSSTSTTLTTIQSSLGSLVALVLVIALDMLGIKNLLNKKNNSHPEVNVTVSSASSPDLSKRNSIQLTNETAVNSNNLIKKTVSQPDLKEMP